MRAAAHATIAHHARLVHSQTGLDVRMSQNFRVLEVAWASAICAVRGRAAAEPLKLEDFLDPPNDGGPEDYWNSQRKLETTKRQHRTYARREKMRNKAIESSGGNATERAELRVFKELREFLQPDARRAVKRLQSCRKKGPWKSSWLQERVSCASELRLRAYGCGLGEGVRDGRESRHWPEALLVHHWGVWASCSPPNARRAP